MLLSPDDAARFYIRYGFPTTDYHDSRRHRPMLARYHHTIRPSDQAKEERHARSREDEAGKKESARKSSARRAESCGGMQRREITMATLLTDARYECARAERGKGETRRCEARRA